MKLDLILKSVLFLLTSLVFLGWWQKARLPDENKINRIQPQWPNGLIIASLEMTTCTHKLVMGSQTEVP